MIELYVAGEQLGVFRKGFKRRHAPFFTRELCHEQSHVTDMGADIGTGESRLHKPLDRSADARFIVRLEILKILATSQLHHLTCEDSRQWPGVVTIADANPFPGQLREPQHFQTSQYRPMYNVEI